MRLIPSLIVAGAVFAAAPVMAQDNAAAPGNTVSTNAADANAVANTAAPMTPTTAAATPGEQNATLPPSVPTSADTGTTNVLKEHHGFPWGVLGLLGLIGLLGVRKVKG